MTTNITPLTPATTGLTNLMPGHVISVSCNVLIALSLMEQYLNSTYALQTADTKLEAAITNQETQIVQDFDNDMNKSGSGLLWQMEHLTPQNDPNGKDAYSADMQALTTEYSAANASNQAQVKAMDANNSITQNILSQNSQAQPGTVQAMQALVGNGSNLVRILQG